MSQDDLGDRMKSYEAHETGRRFLPGAPIYARIDGRNFSNFTRRMMRPFDWSMTCLMVQVTEKLVEHTHARIGYTQSDEISLVWENAMVGDDGSSSMFFGGKVQKMTSVLAGLATAAFSNGLGQFFHEGDELRALLPHFDCRVMRLPSRTEAANMLVWRNNDAIKNAISMAAHAHFSHKALQGKSGREKLEMLAEIGINFEGYPASFRQGTWVRRETELRSLTPQELANIPLQHRPAPDAVFPRSRLLAFELPRLSTIQNREDVIFDGASPVTEAIESPSS